MAADERNLLYVERRGNTRNALKCKKILKKREREKIDWKKRGNQIKFILVAGNDNSKHLQLVGFFFFFWNPW